MKNNVYSNENLEETPPLWSFNLKKIDLKDINQKAVWNPQDPYTGALTLVTKSGFESKHVLTSVIASW